MDLPPVPFPAVKSPPWHMNCETNNEAEGSNEGLTKISSCSLCAAVRFYRPLAVSLDLNHGNEER